MNTYDELRAALKRMDHALEQLASNALAQRKTSAFALRDVYEGFDDLCEYLLKSHARMDRLQAEVAVIKQRRSDNVG